MVKTTRIWKLKFEIKDLLFVAFQQKWTQSLSKLACLDKGLLYTLNRISLAEY